MTEDKLIYEIDGKSTSGRELSIMTDAPFFTEQAIKANPSLANLTRDQIKEMLMPVVCQFRKDSEAGKYKYTTGFFPSGVCGEAREYLVPLIEKLGFFVVCRVFETPIPGFHRVATIGDLLIDPIVDADNENVEEKVYIGPQNERYKSITTAEQFVKVALRYWNARDIVYFKRGGFCLEKPYGTGSLIIPIPGQVPTNLFDDLIAYTRNKSA